MSIVKIEEPHVSVRERIREYPILIDIDGGANVGGVIVAPCGPDLAYVKGPKDFIEKYTVDGNIPRNADITLLNAYYMSFSAGMVIARSMNTTAVNGLFFTTKKEERNTILLGPDDDSFWGLAYGGDYYFCNNGNTSWDDFINILLNSGDETLVTLAGNLQTSYGDKNIYCEDLYDLVNKIQEKLGEDYECAYDGSVAGIITTANLSKSSFSDPTKILIADGKKEERYTLVPNKINFKDGVALKHWDTLEVTLSEDGINTSNGDFTGSFAFVIGTMAYYHGAVDRSMYGDYSLVQVNNIRDIVTSINGIAGLASELDEEFTATKFSIYINYSEGNRLTLPQSHSNLEQGISSVSCSTNSEKEEEQKDYGTQKMFFAVYPSVAQDSNCYLLTVSKDNGTVFLMELRDENGESNSYEVSLLADDLDSTGSNCFIENLNTLGLGFTFVTNPDFKVDDKEAGDASIQEIQLYYHQAFSFGDSGLSLQASKLTTCKINALYRLEDQEVYDIEYFAPFGEMNLQFIKNYTMIGRKNDWFTPVDIPWNKTNPNSIKSYFLNVDNSSNVIALGPFDKNTGLTGWMFYLAPSTLYYSKIMANRAAMKEFAPVFDITNGVLDYTNPCYLLGKEDRVKLLNFKCPINFVLFNQRSQVYYFNDNRTHQSDLNIVSEEQNRRTVNKIKKDVKRLLGHFKGRFNTVSTRADVVSEIRYYFQSQIMNQLYKPNEYEVICDESNNPVEIINANKLGVTVRVRLENAIKYIDVLVDVFPLGVDFASE